MQIHSIGKQKCDIGVQCQKEVAPGDLLCKFFKEMQGHSYSNMFVDESTLKGTNGRQKTYEIFHVYSIFYSGFMCQTTVILGITKDGSLVLNTLASWNCFTCRNLFKNGANDMSECLTFETAFCKKAQNFVQFGSSDFDQISPVCGKHSY